MTTTIFIEDSFDSAHYLPNVPDGHKCKNMHGHTYRIRLECSGELDPLYGWVIDYAEVKDYWSRTKEIIDHRCLNDVVGLSNSTCELLARWIWVRLTNDGLPLSRIVLRETERCGVVYEGPQAV